MGPKHVNAELQRDINDIKESLNSIIKELSDMKKIRIEDKENIDKLTNIISNLDSKLKDKDEKIHQLEKRIEDLEQYSRKEDIIVSGLKTRHKTYSRVVSGQRVENEIQGNELEDSEQELQSLEKQVVGFLNEKNIEIHEDEIAVCHTLMSTRKMTVPNIIVRFVNRKTKMRVMKNAKNLKGTRVYINEHLTSKNGDIARLARNLRKEGKIKATWTRNCSVFIKTLGARPEEEKVKMIKEKNDLLPYQ